MLNQKSLWINSWGAMVSWLWDPCFPSITGQSPIDDQSIPEVARKKVGRGGTRQCARPPPIVRAPATTFGTQVWSCTADSWRWMTLCICSWNSFITILPSLLFMGYFIMLDGKRFPDKIWSGQKTSEFLHSLWKIHLLLVHLCSVYFILKILLEGGRCTGWRFLELHKVGVFVWWKVGWKAADF